MRIAVTGGTGYVGAHMVNGLLAAGQSVRLLVEPGWSNDMLLRRLRASGDLSLLEGDLRAPDIADRLLDGCDAVVHAAGVVGTDDRRERLIWETNALASERIMQRGVE
ncbi:NAD-dependent epimerase/dehydratase family protein [Mycobacterium vicinigordonae]|uniref:NAD-dependent epimerase/dehydratase family protein n=1 Tax=Mycobacterium vicinigordonae TaxID=1719132 RepID=A0A7D6IPA4_9MYCO|nr:NAD-dependent epimerase/dehydratase family protein [Mycobacterium vicinigordonae]QLL05699.1 NAD-dependent epimerase/dehydratase family protein [Mycobacterium vicinigordonae]